MESLPLEPLAISKIFDFLKLMSIPLSSITGIISLINIIKEKEKKKWQLLLGVSIVLFCFGTLAYANTIGIPPNKIEFVTEKRIYSNYSPKRSLRYVRPKTWEIDYRYKGDGHINVKETHHIIGSSAKYFFDPNEIENTMIVDPYLPNISCDEDYGSYDEEKKVFYDPFPLTTEDIFNCTMDDEIKFIEASQTIVYVSKIKINGIEMGKIKSIKKSPNGVIVYFAIIIIEPYPAAIYFSFKENFINKNPNIVEDILSGLAWPYE